MIENEKFKVYVIQKEDLAGLRHIIRVWYKVYNYHDVWCSITLNCEPTYLQFSMLIYNIPVSQGWQSYHIEKSLFTNFYNIEENDFLLYLMAHNHPVKHLKFIVGLYKLHTNQISASELEQLVLDNIEDLL